MQEVNQKGRSVSDVEAQFANALNKNSDLQNLLSEVMHADDSLEITVKAPRTPSGPRPMSINEKLKTDAGSLTKKELQKIATRAGITVTDWAAF